MDAHRVTRPLLILLTSVAMLGGCGSTATPTTTTPVPVVTSSSGAIAHWNLVSISDSVFGSGDENHLEAVDAYAAGIERDLGVDVTVHGYWLGGYTSDQVLDLIRSDTVLQAALSSADAIVFEVPIGEVRSECPFDNVEWHPLPGTPTEWRTCTARTAARNAANAGRIIDEIVALRSPADALILASNLWEIGYRDSLARGIEPQMHDMFTAANAAMEAAAASHGIPVADAWTAYMGPDGRTDPVATGDLLDDMTHLTPQGAAKLAALWRGLGYEKGRAAAAAATVASVAGTATCTWLHVYSDAPVSVTNECTVTADDPRVSGTETEDPWHGQQWAVSATEGAGVQAGRVRLENAGGAWEGTGSGVYSSDRGDILASWFKGTGGYAGLGYFELRTGNAPMAIRGLIFPGDPPDPTGLLAVTGPMPSPNVSDTPPPVPAASPGAIAYGPASVNEGYSEYTFVDMESGVYAGNNVVNDPRVSGKFLGPSWTLNLWGGTSDSLGSGTQWGASRIDTADGTWEGVATGILDNGGDVIAIWSRGTGAYAGLTYFELLARPDLFGPNPGLDVTGAWGQVFPGDPPTP